MPKFTLTAEHPDNTKIVMEFDKEFLQDVVFNMDMFLRGTGFVYGGTLEISEEQTTISSDNESFEDSYHGDAFQFADDEDVLRDIDTSWLNKDFTRDYHDWSEWLNKGYNIDLEEFKKDAQSNVAFNMMTEALKEYSSVPSDICARCFVPREKMLNHTCWDDACPLRQPGESKDSPIK